jgi:hypothetical protein
MKRVIFLFYFRRIKNYRWRIHRRRISVGDVVGKLITDGICVLHRRKNSVSKTIKSCSVCCYCCQQGAQHSGFLLFVHGYWISSLYNYWVYWELLIVTSSLCVFRYGSSYVIVIPMVRFYALFLFFLILIVFFKLIY